MNRVNSKRADSGTYNLLLKNSSGTDEGSFYVTVLDRPGPPDGPLTYENITAGSVTLSWKAPKDNGGSEITPTWVKAAEVVGDVNSGIVPGLTKGNQYEFRVRAVNKAGPGEASEPTLPHLARLKKLAPHIDRNTLSDIKVRAGNMFEFDVKVSGEPPSTKEWSLRGDVLVKTESIIIINQDRSTKLKFIDAKRSDDGIYYLVAKNIHGMDKAAVKVTVLDVP